MGKKLLVADDSATIQKVIKLALSSEGYNILAVSDGREAVRAIQEERPDIVLIDVVLPSGDACTVKRAINQDSSLSFIKFILMASAFEKVDEQATSSVGFDGTLTKPFDPAQLRKMVSDLLKKQSGAAAEIAPPPPPQLSDLAASDASIQDFIAIDPPAPAAPTEITVFEGMEEQESTSQLSPDEAKSLENDIRGLTESTIKMSGLDEYQWNLDDSRKMKAPQDPKGAPSARKGIVAVPSKSFDDGGSNFLKIGLERNQGRPSVPAPAAASGISKSELESLIGKDAQELIERLAKELVPKIAESVIRKEIERILSEP